MNPAKVSSFALWSLTAAIATSLYLTNRPASTSSTPHLSDVNSIAFEKSKILDFLQPQGTVSPASTAAAPSNYKLHGIVHSNQATYSHAVIEDSHKKVKHYAQGQTLPQGEIIHRIDKRSVTLMKNEKETTLQLEK